MEEDVRVFRVDDLEIDISAFRVQQAREPVSSRPRSSGYSSSWRATRAVLSREVLLERIRDYDYLATPAWSTWPSSGWATSWATIPPSEVHHDCPRRGVPVRWLIAMGQASHRSNFAGG